MQECHDAIEMLRGMFAVIHRLTVCLHLPIGLGQIAPEGPLQRQAGGRRLRRLPHRLADGGQHTACQGDRRRNHALDRGLQRPRQAGVAHRVHRLGQLRTPRHRRHHGSARANPPAQMPAVLARDLPRLGGGRGGRGRTVRERRGTALDRGVWAGNDRTGLGSTYFHCGVLTCVAASPNSTASCCVTTRSCASVSTTASCTGTMRCSTSSPLGWQPMAAL